MAGAVVVDTIKSGTANPPTFQNTSGTEIGKLCRAWVTFNPKTPIGSALASYNVLSLTYNATSDYTVTFSNSFSVDGNYVVISGVGTPGGNRAVSMAPYSGVSGVAVGSCRLKYYDTGSGQIDPGSSFTPASLGYAAFFA